MNKQSDCYEIYNDVFRQYPVSKTMFINSLCLNDDNQIVSILYIENRPIAVCVYNSKGITLLAVKPDFQNQGLGTKLLHEAEDYIKKCQKEKVSLGFTGNYLWQGVPISNSSSQLFFEKHGYKEEWISIDMILDLRDYRCSPPKVSIDCTFDISKEQDKENIISCVSETNASWTDFFINTPAKNILIAKNHEKVVGFIMLADTNIRMEKMITGKIGGLSCLGVLPKYRNHGIGLRLAHEGTCLLKKLLFDYSYLGYTWLEDWYGKLGYKKFMAFWMGYKTFKKQS